jgi:hypothetical protein
MKERRYYKRLLSELPAFYKIKGSGDSDSTRVLNLSRQGLCFLSEDSIESHKEAELQIELGPAEAIKLKVKIVWSKFDKTYKKYRNGGSVIGSLSAEDKERFERFYTLSMLEPKK